jgi:serine/threonine-protein kinase PpkA
MDHMRKSGRLTRLAALTALIPVLALLLFQAPASAQGAPMLVEGKKTLYQRLVTHPGAIPYQSPGGAAVGPPLEAFTVLYVYEMKFEAGLRWYRCGADAKGTNTFWLNFDYVTLWNNNMTAMFAEKSGRPQPVLFFKRAESLTQLAQTAGIEGALRDLTEQFDKYLKSKQAPPEDFPVVAEEPSDEEGKIPNKNFYLLPILSVDNSLEGLKFLEVVAINPGDPDIMIPEGAPGAGQGQGQGEGADDGLPKSTGICFVIDTTISMGPYIDATREIAKRIFDTLQQSGKADDIYVAIVAFRSSVERAPGIEYTTKLISDFTSAKDRAGFERSIDTVEEATVSTHSYNEDSIAGINRALDLNWDRFTGGGTIILITDAGPLDLSDPNKATSDSALTVHEKAEAKKVHIVPIHLKSPSGQRNHAYAEKSYRGMASQYGGESAYIDLRIQSAAQGSARYSSFMDGFVENLRAVLEGGGKPQDKPEQGDEDTQEGSRRGAFIGYSIYLNWLGQTKNTAPMSVVRSWISDKDMGVMEKDASLSVRTVDICILLTRNQLSALGDTLSKLVEIGEKVMGDKDSDFFTSILNSALLSGTDPKLIQLTPATKLGEMGFMAEFLEGLPYDSEIMTFTKADWESMTAPSQRDFIQRLKAKIAAYQKFNDNLDGWYKNGEDPGEWLYRVPLTMLP